MSSPKYEKTIRKLTRTPKAVILRLPLEWVPESARWASLELKDGRIIVTILR
jgi:hypothetical protein